MIICRTAIAIKRKSETEARLCKTVLAKKRVEKQNRAYLSGRAAIEPYVVEAIKDLVRDEQFAQAIQDKIGVKVDTSKIDEEIKKYELKLKEIDLNKVRLENEIAETILRRNGIEEDSISLKNIYQILKTFGKIYDIIDEKERKVLITALVKSVDVYAHEEGMEIPLKSIEFNFPVYKNGEETKRVFWETQSSVESVVCLTHRLDNELPMA